MKVATFVAGILAGFFADRNGRKPVMVFGTVIQLLGALLAIASNLPGHVNPWSTFIAFSKKTIPKRSCKFLSKFQNSFILFLKFF